MCAVLNYLMPVCFVVVCLLSVLFVTPVLSDLFSIVRAAVCYSCCVVYVFFFCLSHVLLCVASFVCCVPVCCDCFACSLFCLRRCCLLCLCCVPVVALCAVIVLFGYGLFAFVVCCCCSTMLVCCLSVACLIYHLFVRVTCFV